MTLIRHELSLTKDPETKIQFISNLHQRSLLDTISLLYSWRGNPATTTLASLKLLTTKGFPSLSLRSRHKEERTQSEKQLKNNFLSFHLHARLFGFDFEWLECFYLIYNWRHSTMPNLLTCDKNKLSLKNDGNFRSKSEVCSIIDNIDIFKLRSLKKWLRPSKNLSTRARTHFSHNRISAKGKSVTNYKCVEKYAEQSFRRTGRIVSGVILWYLSISCRVSLWREYSTAGDWRTFG